MSSRYRSRVNESGSWYLTQVTQPSGTVTNLGPCSYSDTESISDVVTPGYARRIADGAVINNPCTYTHSWTKPNGSGSMTARLKSDPKTGFDQSGAVTHYRMLANASSLGLPMTVSSSDASRALDRVKQQAIANIARSQYSFGEDIGEAKETLRYLRNPASSLAEVSKSFERHARNHYYKYGNRLKALSSAWAQYRFAMLPMQRSLEDIIKSSFERNRKSFKKDSRLSARSRVTLTGSNGNTVTTSGRVYAQTRRDEISYHAAILYQTLSPLEGWQYRYGLRLSDIPTTGWNLIPYSFMVDRVANVSDCITGLVRLSDPSLVILAASVTSKHDIAQSCRFINDTNPSYTFSISGETVDYGSFTYNRTIWAPSASDTIPRVDFSGLVRDATSVLDLLSLTTLRLKCFGSLK